MTYKLVLKPRAEKEMAESIEWYEKQHAGLGKNFVRQLELYFSKIQQNPLLYQMRRPPYREAYIIKFPFVIIYELIETEVVVYSIFNTYRNPINKP